MLIIFSHLILHKFNKTLLLCISKAFSTKEELVTKQDTLTSKFCCFFSTFSSNKYHERSLDGPIPPLPPRTQFLTAGKTQNLLMMMMMSNLSFTRFLLFSHHPLPLPRNQFNFFYHLMTTTKKGVLPPDYCFLFSNLLDTTLK